MQRIIISAAVCLAAPTLSNAVSASDFLSKDKRACLRAVKKQTNNLKVVVVSVELSEANNSVTLGVGPQRAPWRCLVKNGTVAEVTSLTDEGKM